MQLWGIHVSEASHQKPDLKHPVAKASGKHARLAPDGTIPMCPKGGACRCYGHSCTEEYGRQCPLRLE